MILVHHLSDSFSAIFKRPHFRELIRHLEFAGVSSLPIVLICVCFAAMVTILESAFHMKILIQNDSLVPGFAALLILRELGAVITCLLLASRVGAGYAAEFASMKVTEQLDALKLLGIDRYWYLVAPRTLACALSGAFLTLLANFMCLYAAFLISNLILGHSSSAFLAGFRVFVTYKDLLFAAIKGFCFGATIPLIASYFGFFGAEGAEGVGQATTKSVVASSVTIIIIDFILSWLFSHFY
ncbi:MAG: organic solvent ABC transporter permease [Bdellovibrionaceae bacterium]|nr:organic solvent ABC transporter permease [Pseudobdellovibrionaceae bacterium]|tara:strand:- start:1003 stop:1725 length:723 start_codon:yes stop_codon:yes gene_type:complete